MSVFWNKILPLMEQQGFTQVDISNAISRPRNTVHNWIKFDRIPPADYALKIADFLGEDLRYLLTGERSEEVVFQYKNGKIKPLVEMLEDKPDEIIEKVYLGARIVLATSDDTAENKKTEDRRETG